MFLSPKIIIFHYLKCYKQNWIFWQRAFPENVKFYKYSFKYWKILFMYYAIMHAVVTLAILVLHFLNTFSDQLRSMTIDSLPMPGVNNTSTIYNLWDQSWQQTFCRQKITLLDKFWSGV